MFDDILCEETEWSTIHGESSYPEREEKFSTSLALWVGQEGGEYTCLMRGCEDGGKLHVIRHATPPHPAKLPRCQPVDGNACFLTGLGKEIS